MNIKTEVILGRYFNKKVLEMTEEYAALEHFREGIIVNRFVHQDDVLKAIIISDHHSGNQGGASYQLYLLIKGGNVKDHYSKDCWVASVDSLKQDEVIMAASEEWVKIQNVLKVRKYPNLKNNSPMISVEPEIGEDTFDNEGIRFFQRKYIVFDKTE